jgi:hypothetical protein
METGFYAAHYYKIITPLLDTFENSVSTVSMGKLLGPFSVYKTNIVGQDYSM